MAVSTLILALNVLITQNAMNMDNASVLSTGLETTVQHIQLRVILVAVADALERHLLIVYLVL